MRLAPVLLLTVLLVACTARVRVPDLEVDGGAVRVEVGPDRPGHCPPGHARKGWC